MSNIFQKLELAFRNQITPRTKESREWFMKKAKAMRGISRNELMKEEPLSSSGRKLLVLCKCFSMTRNIKKLYHTTIGFLCQLL